MIKEQLQKKIKFTYQESMIADYILKNPLCILNMTAKELADSTFSSSSTIVRFCKKLGFAGYPAFQRQYAREYGTKEQFNEKIVLSNVTLDKAPSVLDNVYQYVIKETQLLLDNSDLRKITQLLLSAKKIDLYGSDFNYFALQTFALNLSTLHKPVQAFNSVNNFYVSDLNPEDNVSIIISHSGKNPAMLRIAYELKKRNITTIALTNSVEDSLKNICNYSLYVFTSDEHSRIGSLQWTISVNYILHILYLCLLEHYKKES